MKQHRILVLAGGFAGLWSAVGAARNLDQLGVGSDDVAITLVNLKRIHEELEGQNLSAGLTVEKRVVPRDRIYQR